MANPHPGVPGEIVVIDPSVGWTIQFPAPATIVNNDRFTIASLTKDLTPITLDPNGGNVAGFTVPFDLEWPSGTLEFVYAANAATPQWLPLAGLEPPSPYLDLDMSGFDPLVLDLTWVDAEFVQVLNQFVGFTPPFDFQFLMAGVYSFMLSGTMEVVSSNQGRVTNYRFWNQTDGIQIGAITPIGIGRNTEAIAFASSALVDVDSAMLNKNFRLQFGGGDTVTLQAAIAGGTSFFGVDIGFVAQSAR